MKYGITFRYTEETPPVVMRSAFAVAV